MVGGLNLRARLMGSAAKYAFPSIVGTQYSLFMVSEFEEGLPVSLPTPCIGLVAF